MWSLLYTVCTIVKLYQDLKFNHRAIQMSKWSLECYKGTVKAILSCIMSFLVGRFHCFTGWWRTECSQQSCRVCLPPSSVTPHYASLKSVYMRCINVFRNGGPLTRDTEREAKKASEQALKNDRSNTHLCVHLVVSAVYDGSQETGPGVCKYATNYTHFSPWYRVNSPQCDFKGV